MKPLPGVAQFLYDQLSHTYWFDLDQSCQKIESDSASLYYKADDWDSKIFGVPVIKVNQVLGSDAVAIDKVVKELFKQHSKAYILFRLAQSAHQWIQVLEKNGTIFLDSTIDLIQLVPTEIAAISDVRLATKKDSLKIEEIGQAFGYGRFFTDPDFQKGSLVYKKWIKNSLSGKAAKEVFVLESNKEIIDGFLTTKYEKLGNFTTMEIPLVGKHPQSSQKGVSKKLLTFVLGHAAKQHVDAVTISTQGSNIAAIRAYLSAGFKPFNAGVTMRWFKS